MNSDELQKLLLDKFPAFDPTWPIEIQASWFNGLREISTVLQDIQPRATEPNTRKNSAAVEPTKPNRLRLLYSDNEKDYAAKMLGRGINPTDTHNAMLEEFGRAPQPQTLTIWKGQFQQAGKIRVTEQEIRAYIRDLTVNTSLAPEDFPIRLRWWFGKGLPGAKVVQRILRAECPTTPAATKDRKTARGLPRNKQPNPDSFPCPHSKVFPISEKSCLDYQRQWRRSEPTNRGAQEKLKKCQQCEHWITEISQLRSIT